jgi:hypothetical protein
MAGSIFAQSTSITLSDAVASYFFRFHGQGSTSQTEAIEEVPLREAGNLYGLSTRILTNTLTDPLTVVLRKNGADTDATVTYGTGETGIKSSLQTRVGVESGDRLCLKATLTAGAGTKSASYTATVLTFMPTDRKKTISLLSGQSSVTTSTAGTTYMLPCGDGWGTGAAESDFQIEMLIAGSLRGFFGYLSSNTRNANVSIQTRVNGSDGNCVVTFGATETGLKEDTSNSDVVAVGDLVAVARIVAAGSGSITARGVGILVETANNQFVMANASVASPVTDTAYYGMCGQTLDSPGNVNFRVAPHMTFAITTIAARVTGNTLVSNDTTFATYIDTAAGTHNITYGPGVTGTKRSVGYDQLVGGNPTLQVRVTTVIADGTFTFRWMQMLAEEIQPMHVELAEPTLGSSSF